jgi:hypothetical protein
VIRARHQGNSLDKKRVLQQMLKRFEDMDTPDDLPEGTFEKAQKLIQKINRAFGHAGIAQAKTERPKVVRSKNEHSAQIEKH